MIQHLAKYVKVKGHAFSQCSLLVKVRTVWADGYKIRPVWGPCIVNDVFIFLGLKGGRRQHSIAGQSVRLGIGWSSCKS